MSMLREFEGLCRAADDAAEKLKTYAEKFKNIATIAEHSEYAEVCENLAHVFTSRLVSARTIHMDICLRKDVPIPVLSYAPEETTADVINLLDAIRERQDAKEREEATKIVEAVEAATKTTTKTTPKTTTKTTTPAVKTKT